MTKLAFKAFFLLLLIRNIHPLFAEFDNSLEIRSAAFFHSSERFREIYGYPGASYQVEASTKLYDFLDGWANFDWFSKHGNSVGFNDPTRVSIANISFGIKFPYQLVEEFTAYIGIGPSLSRIWLKNQSECGCQEYVSKLVIGGVLKTGIYYFINKRVFIDVFVDYLCQPDNFETHVDIGGVKAGAGIGIKF
jgi:hypothetical protein